MPAFTDPPPAQPPAIIAPALEYLGTTMSGVRVLIDRGSIVATGPERRVSVTVGAPQAFAGRIAEATQRELFDCTQDRWRMLDYEARDAAGEIIAHRLDAKQSGWRPVEPGSVAAVVRDAVCPAGTTR